MTTAVESIECAATKARYSQVVVRQNEGKVFVHTQSIAISSTMMTKTRGLWKEMFR